MATSDGCVWKRSNYFIEKTHGRMAISFRGTNAPPSLQNHRIFQAGRDPQGPRIPTHGSTQHRPNPSPVSEGDRPLGRPISVL